MFTQYFLKPALIAALITPPLLNPLSDMGFGGMRAMGQSSPSAQWRNITSAPLKPSYGFQYEWNGSDWDSVPSVNVPQSPEESGEEWWYGHCNVKDSEGNVVAYAAVGYATGLNWQTFDGTGCDPWGGWTGTTPPGPESGELETQALRRGSVLRAYIALYDLNGRMLWCRTQLPGTFYDVAQDADGNLVAVGDVFHARRAQEPVIGDAPLPYNPGIGSGADLADVDCSVPWGVGLPAPGPMNTQGFIAKFDLNGNQLWQNAYGGQLDHQANWGAGGRCYSITPIIVQGDPAFYVVMDSDGVWGMRISGVDGTVIDRGHFGQLGGHNIRVLSVHSMIHGGTTHLAFAGIHYTGSVPGSAPFNAFAAHIADVDATPFAFTETWRTIDPAYSTWHQFGLSQNSTDVAFIEDQGQLGIVWPVLSDFDPTTDIGRGRSIAQLRVHRLAPGTTAPVWTADLGEVRAYDLQAGAVQTADGHLAVVTTKWAEEYDQGNPFTYQNLSPSIQNCLNQTVGGINWSTETQYDYWNTDSYVCKLKLADGSLIWQTKFDAEPSVEAACYPADVRKQECLCRITEAPDGGLVISGNTSRNFDDCYLAKVHSDCQIMYDAWDPAITQAMNSEREYGVGWNETWNSDKDIYGTIRIASGHELIIANCTIRFADSEQLEWPSRLIVERGGRLILDGAVITSLDACPNSMWDGVLVKGDETHDQEQFSGGYEQGYLFAKNSEVSHARVGALAANWLLLGPVLEKIAGLRSGGIIQAVNTQWLNNIQDVSFTPYENHEPGDPESILPNRSYFTKCEFSTLGPLARLGHVPADHVTLPVVRGIPFRGCTWGNAMVDTEYEWPIEQGTGIHAINSSFIVHDHCASIGQQGEPCPSEDLTRSSFTNLHRGILAVTFDPSRTFSVDHAAFTGTNYSIRMEGIQDPSITRCSFNVPTPFTPSIVGATYGIYSDQCTGYRIQENHFFTSQPGAPRKVGLVIKDSGPYYNTYYNNSFENLYTGSIIQGNNADANEELGLEVKCNDYGLTDQNTFDVALTGGTVRVQKTQGSSLDVFDPSTYTNPAGNRFSVDHAGVGDPEEDWHVQVAATVVEYFHHTPITGSRTKPDYANQPNELLSNDQNTFWPEKSVACPSELN